MAIELLLATILVSFALGYVCAVRFEGARMKGIKVITKAVKERSIGTQSNEASRRTISTQSQCTYKRKNVTPRFHALPELAEGVFDISFPDEM